MHRFLIIDGVLVNPTFIETASFNAETKTLKLTMIGTGNKEFTGDDAAAAYAALKSGE